MRKRSDHSRSALEQAAADLAGQLSSARENLRRALIEAGDTATARANLRELEHEAAVLAQRLTELDVVAERAAQSQLQARSDELATAAVKRLETQLAALNPPPMPEAR